jgi:hypothetical protein
VAGGPAGKPKITRFSNQCTGASGKGALPVADRNQRQALLFSP